MSRLIRHAPIALLFLGIALLAGGSYGCKTVVDKAPDVYLAQTSEDNVLNNFQVAYRKRDIDHYAVLLANDFQFYFDPKTRTNLGIDFWSRTDDSLRTQELFQSTQVTKIAIQLTWPLKTAASTNFTPPRNTWRFLYLNDVFLDVDFAPVVGQEVTTFRVEDQQQRFYFRKGRTSPPSGPADTLVYIVEWHDEGTGGNSVSELKSN